MVRAATFLAALELRHRVSWPMKAAQEGADGALAAAGSSGAGDVPVAFHILMASCVPFLLSSCIFLRVRFPFHLAIQVGCHSVFRLLIILQCYIRRAGLGRVGGHWPGGCGWGGHG